MTLFDFPSGQRISKADIMYDGGLALSDGMTGRPTPTGWLVLAVTIHQVSIR
jgi:hypothetical protein